MQERILDNTFRLLEEIGRGGFGAVYRAVRIGAEGSGQVAIKLLNKNPAMNNEDYIRFQREATVMSQLVHPGIVTVYELSEDAGSYFIVMEYISGQNLRDFVKSRGGKLSLTETIDILIQAADSLDYVHSHEIIHRDIKPQNILIEENRDRGEAKIQVKLVDFGVARLSTSFNLKKENSEGIVGTYAYMAPEASGMTKWEIDTHVDIYSLGIVAYELVAGKVPFFEYRNEDILKAHLDKDPPPIKSIRGYEVPQILERIIRKCIAKNPKDRYNSMFALACDFKKIQSDLNHRGALQDFEIAQKDIGIGKLLNKVFVARDNIVCEIMDFIEATNENNETTWILIKSGIGLGKSRCLNELKREIELRELKYLYLRFSESEQRLPFQSLSLAINDFIAGYERNNRSKYREFINKLISSLGDMSAELVRLIPALRQFATPSNHGNTAHSGEHEIDEDVNANDDAFVIGQALDPRYVAPNQRVNDAFLGLLRALIGEENRLVFLMDDIHLADTSTISLLLYVLERNDVFDCFSFALTMRDKFTRTNLILDTFSRRLHAQSDVCRTWTLFPFDKADIADYLKEIGITNHHTTFIDELLDKSNGCILQITSIIKHLLAHNAIVPKFLDRAVKGRNYELIVNNEIYKDLSISFVNIESLIASLDNFDKRDLQLMRIAAVCHEACEFEYFRVTDDYSTGELENRILKFNLNRSY